MIDLTLNSITIPDIAGYPQPFGTKVVRNPSNKGGLSSREVNNNIIAAFSKMRPITISSGEETTTVEYDAKLFINAENAITLNLGNANYFGCSVQICNSSAVNHTLHCASVSQADSVILAGESVELLWNGTAWQNITAPGVGKLIVQFPQEETPARLFPCTSWVEKDFNGSFFRSYKNGVSNAFINKNDILGNPQEAGTSVNKLIFNSETLETEINNNSPKTYYNDQHNSYSHTHGHLPEPRFVIPSEWTPVTIPGIRFIFFNQNGGEDRFQISGNSYTSSVHLTGVSSGSHNHKFTPSGTISSSDIETRPDNYAVKIWERIA